MTENEQRLQRLLSGIGPLYEAPMREAKARQDALAKPPGSLGLLEEISIRLAGITGTVKNEAAPTRIYVLAADNGVVSEGVSSAPQSVTRAQAINLTRGLTGASCLAKHFHDGLTVVDMGIALPYTCPEILDRSLGKGTANIAAGPAMPRPAAVQGILTGMELAAQARQDGIRLLGVGEMGIGNTTTSSAVAAVLLGQPIEVMTGRGAGLSDAGLARKLDAIRRGIARNQPDAADPLDVLSKLGGFDIAGLCGVFLGGALEDLPILMDGFISGVAALCAVRLCPAAAKAVFASHCSTEPAARLVLEALGKAPLLTAGLHLGEGTGAVASLPLWDLALAVYDHCYSFTEGGIPPYTPQC
ncbi:MAG: nicotinate-nucleotide--dimethylbenzimidazole phosphoribosyltransferase [Clostridiales bacterium]|nr:nicotinate-nucleotide--dimethylbenzimidazole phosphoribosyltransferase [Clostridiales bacterium]